MIARPCFGRERTLRHREVARALERRVHLRPLGALGQYLVARRSRASVRSCYAPTRGEGHRAGSGRLGARQGMRMRCMVFLDRCGRGLAVERGRECPCRVHRGIFSR